MDTSRRTFLQYGASIAGATVVTTSTDVTAAPPSAPPATAPAGMDAFETPPGTRKGDMLYRSLGRTGEEVSLLGMGGFHIGKLKDEQESIKLIRTAIDRGITFMDNSWDYNEGRSEIRMGKALRDGYRQKVFLMTKIDGRTKESAARQIDESLKRLQTDRLDLLQFHEIIRMEDPDRIFAEGGALEAAMEAKKAGKFRYIGFTGHKDPLVHLRMLQVAAEHGFHFDTVQMPVNVMDAHFRSFQFHVLPVLLHEQIAPLAMKSLGDPFILESGVVKPIEALHFTMNRPVSVVITGIDSMAVLDQALEAVRTFKPLTLEQVGALMERSKNAAETGKFEKFKTTTVFDSTAHNPQWLG
ncbi:MAG: Twin-arginine translocation pathway signal [Phycisphaerales bacterium]|nr:Twin-arginine translocation pathway signal [Phycisphaerales bacterium]